MRLEVCSEADNRRRILVPAFAPATAESPVKKPTPAPVRLESPIAQGSTPLLVVPVPPSWPTKAYVAALPLIVATSAPAADPSPSARSSKVAPALRVTAPCVKLSCWPAPASKVKTAAPALKVIAPLRASLVAVVDEPRMVKSAP